MSPIEQPLFQFEGVSVVRDGRPILDSINLAIPERGITCVVGPSGSGKSTLLRLCNRLEVPSRGAVRFHGTDLAAGDPLAHRRRVGMVFQRPVPFPGTVADNLLVADPAADRTRMVEVLRSAHLPEDYLGRRADDLSGGESQRACLARTLMARPEVLLMDEPTSALDAEAAAALEQLARGLADRGVPIIWVSHDPAQVERVADRVVGLESGRVVSGGG